MSHGGYSISISIRGNIKTKKLFSDLMKAAIEDNVGKDTWNQFPSNDAVKYYIMRSEGKPLIFTKRDHDDESLSTIEEVCLNNDLSFVRTNDPDGDNDVDGSRYVYNPSIDARPFDLPGSDDNTPLINAKVIQKIMDVNEDHGHMVRAIQAEVAKAINPTKGMPEGITLDKKLREAPSAKTTNAP